MKKFGQKKTLLDATFRSGQGENLSAVMKTAGAAMQAALQATKAAPQATQAARQGGLCELTEREGCRLQEVIGAQDVEQGVAADQGGEAYDKANAHHLLLGHKPCGVRQGVRRSADGQEHGT